MPRDPNERFEFLVRISGSDLDALDRIVKRQRTSRQKYVIIAIAEKLRNEPAECPICGRTEDHVH